MKNKKIYGKSHYMDISEDEKLKKNRVGEKPLQESIRCYTTKTKRIYQNLLENVKSKKSLYFSIGKVKM